MHHRPDFTAAVERMLRARPAPSHAELANLIRDAAPVWAAIALARLQARAIDAEAGR
jgi:hypothetical protein